MTSLQIPYCNKLEQASDKHSRAIPLLNLRAIIIGAGFWGERWIESIQKNKNCEISAIVARTHDTLNKIKKKFNIISDCCFTDYKKAIKEKKADFVVVVVPPAVHYEVIECALESGLNILCEKPIAANWNEAVKISKLSFKNPKQKFMISQTRRWSNHIQSLKKVIDSGKIGKIGFMNIDHRVHNRLPGWREELKYPVIEDMAVHHFDAIRFVTGEETKTIYAQSFNPKWSWYKGRATSSVLVTMTNGVYVNYFGSWCTQGEQTTWEGEINVVGEKGSLKLVDEVTLEYYTASDKREPATNPEPEKIAIPGLSKFGIDYALDEFLSSIRENREPECSLRDNLKTFVMSCAAVESCCTGKIVNIEPMLNKVYKKDERTTK